MRLLRLWAFSLLFLALPAWAQEDTAVFRVADVAVEANAANAAQARDQALLQGQRQAFEQLLTRMGVDPARAANLNADTLDSFVQSFEIQKEFAAGQRYNGVFAFQFKPAAVRGFLEGKGVAYTETRAQKLLVLPILRSGGRDVLWEEVTLWRSAWDEEIKRSVAVPLVMPVGDLSDIAMIGASEALEGKMDRLTPLINKYSAQGALVVLYQPDQDKPEGQQGATVEARRFDLSGKNHEPVRLTLAPVAKDAKPNALLAQAADRVVKELDTGWRQEVRGEVIGGPASTLEIGATVPTLASWNRIRTKLSQTPGVVRVKVVTMTRGLVQAALDYRGDLPALQTALAGQGLQLTQNAAGAWTVVEPGVQ